MSVPGAPRAGACEQFEQDLVLLYYGELSGAERETVAGHAASCPPCARYLEELRATLPMTIRPDQPPPEFWHDYGRLMRIKLDQVDGARAGWRSWFGWLGTWPASAIAAAVIALALGITFKGGFSPEEVPPEERALIEFLPVGENLEFFETMDLLDAMEELEAISRPSAREGRYA